MQRVLTALAAGLLLAASASAQSLFLDKQGGALGAVSTVDLAGTPGRAYLVLVDLKETVIDLGGGLKLNVGFDLLPYTIGIPGFLGTLDGSGRAQASFTIPDDPAFLGQVLSFQALAIAPLDDVSNLARVTPARVETFTPTLDTPLPLVQPLALPQADGTVLLLEDTLPVVQAYDPRLEEWSLAGLGCAADLWATRTVLADGRVLLAGGLDPASGQPSDRAVLWDPVAGSCTEYTMPTPRAGHAATLTGNGDVLLVGGFQSLDWTALLLLLGALLDTADLFDPVAGTFRPAGTMLEPKAFHTATTKADGNVLVAGGLTLVPVLNVPLISPTAYGWNATKEAFDLLPILFPTGRMLHSAVLLDDQRILLAGGINVDFTDFLNSGGPADLKLLSLADGELWTKGFLGGSFQTVQALAEGRALPGLQALPGARALVAGGFDLQLSGDISTWVYAPSATADLYENKAFRPTGAMAEARIHPTLVLLDDGTVLTLGGGGGSAEVFQQ